MIDFGDVSCTLRVDRPHYSTRSLDASVHSTVSCVEDAGPRNRYRSELIEVSTEMHALDPYEFTTTPVASCRDKLAQNSFKFEVPCHGPWVVDGPYTATTEAAVTVRGVRMTMRAERTYWVEKINVA